LGATGWFPVTAKVNAAAFGEGTAECVAERVVAGTDAGGPAAGDDAEQPGSTAAAHKDAAKMTDLAGIRRERPMSSMFTEDFGPEVGTRSSMIMKCGA
jgi:hypothetical protein